MNDSAGVLHAPLVRAQVLEDRLGRRRVQDVESQGGRRGKGGVRETQSSLFLGAFFIDGRFLCSRVMASVSEGLCRQGHFADSLGGHLPYLGGTLMQNCQ